MSEKNKEKSSLSSEEKAKAKLDKINKKEAKKSEKKKRKEEMNQLYSQLDPYHGLTKEEKIKKTKEIKIKKTREKVNVRLAFKEAPVKMLKEVNKIRWSDRRNLGQKFTWVIVFLLIFGAFFYAIDTGLQYLFILLKIT